MNPLLIGAAIGAGISGVSKIVDIIEQNEIVAAEQVQAREDKGRVKEIKKRKKADLKDQYVDAVEHKEVMVAQGGAAANSGTILALKAKMASDYKKYKSRISKDADYSLSKIDFRIDRLEREKVGYFEGSLLVGGAILGGGAQGANMVGTYGEMGAFGGEGGENWQDTAFGA